MAMFFLWIALMVVLTVAVLLWPLMRAKAPDSADRQAVNLAIAKQRLRELSLERENGTLGEEAFDQAKYELELTLAGDLDDAEDRETSVSGRWMATIVLLCVPVSAVWLYASLGSPAFLDGVPEVPAAQRAAQEGGPTAEGIETMIKQLEARMQEVPDDAEGQRLLIGIYMRQGRFADAVASLESWGARENKNADLLVMLADASASLNGGRLLGEPEELLKQALTLNPEHLQGLWIMGYTQAQKNNPQEAIAYWQRLLPLVVSDTDAHQRVSQSIADARSQAGLADDSAAPAAQSGAGLSVRVSIDPSIAEGLNPELAVFVYAKTPSGPPMPLAVSKHRVADLPLVVTLDDSTAMIPNHKLSLQSAVVVGARVSLTGNPVAQAGDFYIEQDGVALPQTGDLDLVISIEK